jgi:hypothetical protein
MKKPERRPRASMICDLKYLGPLHVACCSISRGNLRGDPLGSLRSRWALQRLRSVSEHFSHEETKAPLVGMSRESGEGASLIPIKVVVMTMDLIVEWASENENLIG